MAACRALVAVLALALCVSVASAKEEPLPPLHYVGVFENLGMYDYPDRSQPTTIAHRIAGFGFNTERISFTWNRRHPQPSRDQLRWACNAAVAAAVAGVPHLMLGLIPEAGGYPATGRDRTAYTAAIRTYVSALIRPGKGCVSRRSGHPLRGLTVLPVNEPNIPTFCRPQTDDDHTLCADRTVQLLAQVYPALKKDARSYGVPIAVVCGGLSSHHTPIEYMQAEAQARDDRGIKAANCDIFGFHPYSLYASSDPLSGFGLFDLLKQNIWAEFDRDLPVLYDEFAVETIVPPTKGYTCTGSTWEQEVPEDTQAGYYDQALTLARKQGALGVLLFLLQDEQCLSGWQSGEYYWDGTPKGSLPGVHAAVLRALGRPPDSTLGAPGTKPTATPAPTPGTAPTPPPATTTGAASATASG